MLKQCLQSRIKLVNVLTSHYATYYYVAIYQVKCQTITLFHFLPCRQFIKIMLLKVMISKDWRNRRIYKWIWSIFNSSKVISVEGEWCELSSCSTMHRSKRFCCKKMLNILTVHFWNSLRTWEWPQVRKQFEEQQILICLSQTCSKNSLAIEFERKVRYYNMWTLCWIRILIGMKRNIFGG